MSDTHQFGLLLSRTCDGDLNAFDALLATIRPYLRLLVRQQLESSSRERLGESDIVQETLIRIHGGLNPVSPEPVGRFEGHSPVSFLAWIGRIVHNVIVDMERRGRAKKRDWRREVPGSTIIGTLADGRPPGQGVEHMERVLQLAAALERLPSHQREVLEWRIFDKLSYGEIADRTGKTEGALRVVVLRAIESLREDEALRRLMEAGT